ncbi:MAG: hemin uptake protein HemP [Rhodocyclaceae bacterium]|jgi:hemin uptake protein HemP|nr:hemin uptake protein HemP [Rhodocyclaceae bacterium]
MTASAGNKPVKPAAQAAAALRREAVRPGTTLIASAELFAGRSEIVIAHGQETYRLRLTRQNKLILTK